MKLVSSVLLLISLLISIAIAGEDVPRSEASRKIIAHARVSDVEPSLPWNYETVLAGDINCDGIDDYCVSACADSVLYLAVVIGPPSASSRVSTFGIECNPISQYGLGGWPPRLWLEALDYDLSEYLETPVPGFRQSPDCVGILVMAGQIDPFHLFWSHETDDLVWWRL